MIPTRPLETIIVNVDRGLRAVAGVARGTGRDYPAERTPEQPMGDADRRHAAALMRVNHAGEVAAQALYHGQSLTARSGAVRDDLQRAAAEEEDHLLWCRRRLEELDQRPSLLDPFWYAGSFAMGALAGLAGDRVNLGFLEETERQVEAHLGGHLERLPPGDDRSRAVVTQMQRDEASHARMAQRGGAAPMPRPVRKAMSLASRLMTGTAYWV
jgi:ubiquinone biosynthesis monooxygenase Coq7